MSGKSKQMVEKSRTNHGNIIGKYGNVVLPENMGNTLGQQLETMGKDRKLMRRSGLTGMKLGKILGISLPECAAEINIGMIMG